MKRVFQIPGFALIASLLLTSTVYASKKPFEGTITYKISYINTDLEPEMMNYLPKVSVVMIKGDMTRTNINSGMGNQSAIFNSADNTSVTLLDMMGQKFALRSGADEYEKEVSDIESQVEVTGETKEIAGYNCKKAIVTSTEKKTGTKSVLTVYFTDEIQTSGNMNKHNPVFKDVSGVMLEYEIQSNEITMKLTATKVQKGKISDSEFTIPEGYKITTKEELQSTFGR